MVIASLVNRSEGDEFKHKKIEVLQEDIVPTTKIKNILARNTLGISSKPPNVLNTEQVVARTSNPGIASGVTDTKPETLSTIDTLRGKVKTILEVNSLKVVDTDSAKMNTIKPENIVPQV